MTRKRTGGAPVSGAGGAGWLQKAALDLDPDAPSFPSPCIVLHSTIQEKRPHLFLSCLVKSKRNVLWYCESLLANPASELRAHIQFINPNPHNRRTAFRKAEDYSVRKIDLTSKRK